MLMTKEETNRKKRVWERLRDMKDSKHSIIDTNDMDDWEEQSLPGGLSRDIDLKIERPSRVKKGDTWSIVQTAISLTVDQHPVLQMIAAEEDDQKKAIVLQNIIDYIWGKCKGDINLYYTVLSAARYGTGIAKVFYKADKRKIKDIELYNPETKEIKYKEKEVIDYNDICWEMVDIRNFFPDNRASNMEECIDCFERKIISFEQFEYLYDKERYKNIHKVKPNQGGFDSTSDEYRSNDPEPFEDYRSDKVELIVYYNKFKDEQITYANGIEIEYIPIPHKHKQLPYVRCVFFPRGKEYFWGIGIPELLEHDQAALDTILNISIDRMKFSLNKPLLVGGGEDFDDNINIEPGQIRNVQDVRNYLEMNIQPPDSVSFNMMDYLSQDARRKVGADDPMSGIKSGGTATENAIAKESGLRRMKVFLRLLENETMERLGRLMVSDIQQFYGQPLRVEKIVGRNAVEKMAIKAGLSPSEKEVFRKLPINIKKVKDEFGLYNYEESKGDYFEIKPEDIMGHFDIKVKANSSIPVSKELEHKKLTDAIAIASGSPLVNITNWQKVAEKYWSGLFNTDGSEFLLQKQDIEQEMNKLAEEENKRMMEGEDIPSTQNAPLSHSLRHRALIESKEFKELPEETQQVILSHLEGELVEQRKKEAEGPGRPIQNQGQGKEMAGRLPTGGPATRAQVNGQPTPDQPSQQARL